MLRAFQLLSLLFLFLYTYLSEPVYPGNMIWLIFVLMVFILGIFRKPIETLVVAGLLTLIYGGYQLYLYYVASTLLHFGWSELVWLLLFPYAGILGGIGKQGRTLNSQTNRLTFYQQLHSAGEYRNKEISTVDVELEYLSGTAFVYKLEEEVLNALRERRRFSLFLIEIVHFMEYKSNFGFEQSQLLLNQIARLIIETPIRPNIKAHLGEGIFAVLLPQNGQDHAQESELFQNQLNDLFLELMMTKSLHESRLRLRLKYGVASCPEDGIEARSLMDWAQDDLERNEVDS